MKVLFVIDPLEGLLAEVDASIGLMDRALALGAEVWVCVPEQLTLRDGRVLARASRLTLHPRSRAVDHRWMVRDPWCERSATEVVDVADTMTLVLLRIDPPVDARYLHTTYLLDLVHAAGCPVWNRPDGVRLLHEKLYPLWFPELCPATVVSADPMVLADFVSEHRTAG